MLGGKSARTIRITSALHAPVCSINALTRKGGLNSWVILYFITVNSPSEGASDRVLSTSKASRRTDSWGQGELLTVWRNPTSINTQIFIEGKADIWITTKIAFHLDSTIDLRSKIYPLELNVTLIFSTTSTNISSLFLPPDRWYFPTFWPFIIHIIFCIQWSNLIITLTLCDALPSDYGYPMNIYNKKNHRSRYFVLNWFLQHVIMKGLFSN